MSTVFVFGASGFIGTQVALSFRAAGYRTIGLVRTASKANELLRGHVEVVEGTLENTASWYDAAARADVLVLALVDYANMQATDRKLLDLVTKIASSSNEPSRKTVLYTSGAWIYGNRPNEVVDEQSSTEQAFGLVQWRRAHEKEVATATHYDGVVLRPGLVYGRTGSMTASWIAAALNPSTGVSVPSNSQGSQLWSFVHVDDVAQAYVLAAKNARPGRVYNLCSQTLQVNRAIDALFKATGNKNNAQFPAPTNPFEEALAGTQNISAEKARIELGWKPAFHDFEQEASVLVKSWSAYQL